MQLLLESFCSLMKGTTRNIGMLCFVLTNSVLFSLLCVWILLQGYLGGIHTMKGAGEVMGWMRYSPSKLLLLYPCSYPSPQSESKMSEVTVTISLDL